MFVGEVTDIAVRMLSDVDLGCVEKRVGEKTEDEEKRQRESGSENEVKEPVCPLDALHRMEQTIRFNSCGNTFHTKICGEKEPVEAQKSIHRRWVRAPKNWQVQVETTSACWVRSSHAN